MSVTVNWTKVKLVFPSIFARTFFFFCKSYTSELIRMRRVRMRITNVCTFKMNYNFLYVFHFYHARHFNLYLVRNAYANLFSSQM